MIFVDTSPAPYGGTAVYVAAGLNPMMKSNSGTSPQAQYILPVDTLVRQSPSPLESQQYNFQATYNLPQASNVLQMPSVNAGLTNYMINPQNWNIPNVQPIPEEPHMPTNNLNSDVFGAEAGMAIDGGHTGLSNILNLDSQELTQLNSAELAGLNAFDLSENLSNNLSLSDIKVDLPRQDDGQENMTDSFTRLTNSTIDNLCTLNKMYKPNIDG